MKARNPYITYLLCVATFFIYFYFWMFFMMKNINTLRGEKVFNVRNKAILIAILYGANIYFYKYLDQPFESHHILMLVSITIALVITLTVYYYLRQISVYIAEMELNYNINPISKKKMFILSLFFVISVVYIQMHMNRIIEIKQGKTNSLQKIHTSIGSL